MAIVCLDQQLFLKDYLQGQEIIDNKGGSRPYYCSFKNGTNRICMPFRSSCKTVPNKYKIHLGYEQPNKPHSALDLTKLIVISNQDYLQH
ncbi:hypothetical protein MUA26_00700 [Staphylococcus sp. IVB6246]|uniref:hypothetical protein n=1 Tax=Staphylococcus sp. IVB6246 TaxID=2989772 RepID=UPI0021CEDABA|nr:hypothetical protein [Staphylococcus sp. IVB6246]UXR69717.1 hypothetical protein MUA26_00700 [Staphylococcus sp. IVB6246]